MNARTIRGVGRPDLIKEGGSEIKREGERFFFSPPFYGPLSAAGGGRGTKRGLIIF